MDVSQSAQRVRPDLRLGATGRQTVRTDANPAAGTGRRRRAPDFERRYREALHRHLSGSAAREIDFFVNDARFDLMRRTIGSALARPGLRVLNAASGPFAFEHYAAPEDAVIHAFDRDVRLVALHQELIDQGLIAECRYEVSDVASYRARARYDVVLVNDLFYAPSLNLFDLLGELAASVAPGGLMYFDVQDERAGPVWSAFGKGGTTRRYDLAEVKRAIEHLGFEVLAVAPSLGIKGGLDHLFRRALWSSFGIANNFAFAARRRD